ncbi:hypothetical protein [Streptomyces sp. ICBB 8177]|uniref:hypothetical protein n=1 Tax=Streptomyces sp. ICBB 8177 TaxID=563922 RepID=UPI001F5470F9|nr:hypothetical protein [Streptomyces sp. ICBB 8177]
MSAPSRAAADLRLMRAAVFAAVCVTLSAAGHAMASGGPIPLWTLLAGWAAVFAVAASLAGRERSLPGIAALLLVGELALHMLFSAGQWCAASASNAGGAGGGQSQRVMALAVRLVCHAQGLRLTPGDAARLLRQAGIDPASAPALPSPPAMPGMPWMSVASGGSGAHFACGMWTPSMLLGHLAAAVIAGWVLRRGEAALWRLVRLAASGAAGARAALPRLRDAFAAAAALAVLLACLFAERRATRARATGDAPRRARSAGLQHTVIRRGPPAVALAA